jgi:hypothetical protein
LYRPFGLPEWRQDLRQFSHKLMGLKPNVVHSSYVPRLYLMG